MTVILNGEKYNMAENMSVLDLLNEKGVNPDRVVVEYNKNIVPKSDFANIKIAPNDTLEVLEFVGGG